MVTPAQETAPVTPPPAEPVPVAVYCRTSTLALQDPVASVRRQLRSCEQWLPPGWFIAAVFSDVESGGTDLDRRGHGDGWRVLTDAGLPRDGGIADLLSEAASPTPRFVAALVEDIERSARDMLSSLGLEKQLSAQGIPLFATDEPADIAGMNATTVLVRRVKQGVAEWYRIQLKEKVWKGLVEHSMDGWNTGPAPHGYLAERVPHPNPVKAAQGRTKSRLVLDSATAPTVEAIFTWRTVDKLGLPAIAIRLNASPALYPAPAGSDGWTPSCATPSTPGTRCSAVTAPGAASASRYPRPNGCGLPSRRIPPSSTGPPGRVPRASALSTPIATTVTRPRRRRTRPTTCTGRGYGARPASGG